MKYKSPELELILFENTDVLTDSNELPVIPLEEEPGDFSV